MKRSIPFWQMAGFVFTGVVGTLLHFLFDLAGGSVIAALFSAVNESIWEHLKLLFYPMLAFAMTEYLVWGKEISAFWCIKLMGMGTGLLLIPMIYYGYTGILGVSADWFNIAIFFVAAAMTYWMETRLFRSGRTCPVSGKLALVLIGALVAVFTVLTFVPPCIPLFRDPVSGTYGFLG